MRILTILFTVFILQLSKCGNEGKDLASTARNGPSGDNNGDSPYRCGRAIGVEGQSYTPLREASQEFTIDLSLRGQTMALEEMDEHSGVIHRSLKDGYASKKVVYGIETIWVSERSSICIEAEIYIKQNAAVAILGLRNGSSVTYKAFQRMVGGWLDVGVGHVNWVLHEMMYDIEANVSLLTEEETYMDD
ncbi:hypothetical protein BEWA_035480 [Theileria equi strain WA]|uniref:Signal peptide containing protein n=1 Tax=Theileria equi strain WA TaxID=1537102 RepID=L1LDI5_THEEQ|nr:hypothetical protein BEWA_035480 [Theileria equi strain WA]EKX73512.1 hypothetical protein BEWA_035480 [Theileria equi strain WA]|eukprot:XP_004832964.1 hypothetical protein BEWA_035480 [Theileria equi strain WA]